MGFVFDAVSSVVKAVVGVVKGVVKAIGKVAFGLIGLVRPKGNAKNAATDGRLSKSLQPEDARKIVFGKTAFGCDLRFWEVFTPPDWNDYAEVIACATHRVHSFGKFYAEDKLIGFDAGGTSTNSQFEGMTRKTNNGALGNAALPVGSGTYWTATSKFTGCAHYRLHWKTDEKKLPGGVPTRYTQEGEGAPVYDPRKDSPRGGVGAHRADDQLTWDYIAADSNGQPIGRNNALQMLWYLIGWRINGVLVAGRGVDLNDINWPEMIAAANDAEARQYYTDMILSTEDSHETNENIISADGLLGELLDPGGLWTYKVTKDDTADIAVTLTDDDVIDAGDVEWTPAPSMGDQFNEVAGTYIDPSATSLYQPKAYPTVTDASYIAADGFRKRVSHDFQCVQDVSLAQKLSRIKLNRTRFPGEFKATFNYRALKAQVWSNVRLSLERYGFVSKLFRVYAQTVSETGIEMVLREEDPSVYAAGTVTVPPAPGSVPGFDPFLVYPVTGLTAAAIAQAKDGTTMVGVHLGWDAPADNVRRLEVEYKRTVDATWQPAGMTAGTSASIDLLGLLGTTSYDFRVRSWSNREQPSAWATVTIATTASSVDWAILSGELPADVANETILDSIASNDVLSRSEKLSDLSKLVADLEARYVDLLGRASTLALSTAALTTARTNWFALLNSFVPAWNDTTQDTTIHTTAFPDQNFPAGWTLNGATTSANGAYTTVTDSSGTQYVSRIVLQAAAATTYSFGVAVKKDAVGQATRNPMVVFQTGGGTFKAGLLAWDTSTGAFAQNGNLVDCGVLDLGADWFVWGTFTTNADNTAVEYRLYPAYGTALSFVATAATVGSIDAKPPVLTLGAASKLGRHYLTGRQAAYSAAMAALQKAISQTDAQLANQPTGPATFDAKYDSSGTTPQNLPASLNYKLQNQAGQITSGITWKYVVISGTVNGHAAGATEYTDTIIADTGTGVFTLNSMVGSSAKIEVRAYMGTLVWPYQTTINKVLAAPSGGGGGGGGTLPQTVGVTTGISGSTFTKIGQVTGTTGAAQTSVSLSASFDISDTAAVKSDSVAVELKWMRSGVQKGSTGSGSCSIVNWEPIDGSVSASATDTGLTANNSYTWELWARCTVSTKAVSASGSGTAT